MEVSSYVFQSPYHASVQVGRPDPLASKQADSQENGAGVLTNQEQNRIAQNAALSSNQGSSINVALSLGDEGVSASLGGFQSLNAKAQALSAYVS